MRKRIAKEMKPGDLVRLRSCIPELRSTQIESLYDDQASHWVPNGEIALIVRKYPERDGFTVLCQGFLGWVWEMECYEKV